ncbi:hypothetical protein J1605_017409 [Eschrichtius robustus]|uniref:C2 domain-containing protein n=1 Tax=Eschrichtius robustus TaxID=9764 RepID=A0AB34I251_ESCRO|nr:hypothetical protein J1605_017409 [Eschrichtius robustus]
MATMTRPAWGGQARNLENKPLEGQSKWCGRGAVSWVWGIWEVQLQLDLQMGRGWQQVALDRYGISPIMSWFYKLSTQPSGKHETAGAKLLQSYQKLSKISVVPPTPPPLSESWCSGSPGRFQELGQFKGFNKSVENLFLSVTTHMKKLSKSQNDMTSDKQRPAVGPRQCEGRSERRSQSDTAVNVTTRKVSAPDILKPLNQESPKCPTSPVLKQEDISSSPAPNTLFSGGLRHGSLISINSTCTEMGNFDKANVTGEIEFAIRYCFRTHSLEVCIKACKNLAYGEEKKKKCNPYVKTYLLPDRSSQGKRKTGVQKNTVEPTFQETLKYQVEPTELATRQLRVSVWHLGTLTRRVFLGEVVIPLATWDFEDRTTQSARWYPLQAKAEKDEDSVPTKNGELVVRAKLVLPAGPRKLQEAQEASGSRDYKSFPAAAVRTAQRGGVCARGTGDQPSRNGQLCLVVLGAKNLPVRSDGTLNSFVKGCLTLPDQQRLRLKSPVLKKQACPQWKHSFVFKGVTPSQLRQSTLELTVWDQATFGVNDRLLGGARLGSVLVKSYGILCCWSFLKKLRKDGECPLAAITNLSLRSHTEEEPAGGADSCSQSKLQWQKVLSSPNLWTDMTLTLH